MNDKDINTLFKKFNFAYADKKIEEITLEYAKQLFVENKSPLTIKEYLRTISHFLNFLKKLFGEEVSINILKNLQSPDFTFFFSHYSGKREEKESEKERMLVSLYYFNNKKTTNILPQHKSFFSKIETKNLINNLEKFLKKNTHTLIFKKNTHITTHIALSFFNNCSLMLHNFQGSSDNNII